jgi:tetratricopeptide (TPR) repeat protein
MDKDEEYALKALEIDPETAQAYKVLGLKQYYLGKTKDAVPLLRKGYSLDPNDTDLLVYGGWSCILVGRTSEALTLANRAIDLDPITPFVAFKGVVLFYQGKFMEAANVIKQILSPAMLDIPFGRCYMALFLAYPVKTNEALDILEPLDMISTSDLYLQNARFLKYALQGKKDRITELMTDEFILAEKRGGVESSWAASFYAIVGDFDTALDWLEHSVSRDFINYPYMSQYDPFLTKMRGNSRYDKLMERVKYEWENFEV